MANQTTFKDVKFSVGDTVRVEQKIKEGDKKRIQVFEGIVIKIKGPQENKSITVRRIGTGGIGIEKIWPLNLPSLQSIKVVKKGKVRRAKLYYLRKRVGKKAIRIREQKVMKVAQVAKVEKDEQKKKKSRKARRTVNQKGSSK